MKLDSVDINILAAIPDDDFVSRESIGRAMKMWRIATGSSEAVSYRLRTLEAAGYIKRDGNFYTRIDALLGGEK